LTIIATIAKAESHSTCSDISAVKAEITTERFPRVLVFAVSDAILVTREPVLVCPRGRWTMAIVAGPHGLNDRAGAATLILIHPIGMAPIDTGRGSSGDQTLSVERGARGDRRVNVEW
jgi:hypothetical protein